MNSHACAHFSACFSSGVMRKVSRPSCYPKSKGWKSQRTPTSLGMTTSCPGSRQWGHACNILILRQVGGGLDVAWGESIPLRWKGDMSWHGPVLCLSMPRMCARDRDWSTWGLGVGGGETHKQRTHLFGCGNCDRVYAGGRNRFGVRAQSHRPTGEQLLP